MHLSGVYEGGCRNPPTGRRKGLSPKPITIEQKEMNMSTREKQIRPLDGFANASDADVVSRATLVQTNMTGNVNFPTTPVDLAALKTAIDRLSALMAEALDGSKKVIAEKEKQRTAVIKMLRLVGRYVEVACKNDMAIFKSSGFEPASATKTATPPLSEKIRKIEHGANSGQIVVWIRSIPKASSYEIRYGVGGGGGRFSNCGNEAAIRYRDSPIRRMCSSSIH